MLITSILITSFGAYATTLRNLPEHEKLITLMKQIANVGYDLITLTETTNTTSKVTIPLPSRIGTKRYWIKLTNDSQQTWLEGALGPIRQGNLSNRIYLLPTVQGTGNYTSEVGIALLECTREGSTINLHLDTWGGSA